MVRLILGRMAVPTHLSLRFGQRTGLLLRLGQRTQVHSTLSSIACHL
mgnify:FL=1